MRRIDREMDSLFALQILDKCPYAVLSMITSENAPYCIPLSIVRIGNKIYFHSAKEGRKISTLRQHSQVCLSCVGDIHCMENKFTLEYESAVINGIAQEVFNEEEKILALMHDILEDTSVTVKDLEEFGYNTDILNMLLYLLIKVKVFIPISVCIIMMINTIPPINI